eukprot:CAMPEP_0185848144 /NCGR_PEP_ID=MMETSP1354-20130828/3137_1 /TAXON_ID=708628 /ORGANISM="Erythrolobus madagascarensis, Strain CCMP3276" /LENGTH=86 /DNA_ID=CAMNT_0028548507 /DNA_START=375 /DNA_END=633 /DNA_ORIENTATION=+
MFLATLLQLHEEYERPRTGAVVTGSSASAEDSLAFLSEEELVGFHNATPRHPAEVGDLSVQVGPTSKLFTADWLAEPATLTKPRTW